MSSLALLAPLLPLALAGALASRSLRNGALALAPWAALPSLALALGPQPEPLRLEAVMLGTVLARDGLGQAFLLLAAVVWTAAGAYARTFMRDDGRRATFQLFFLLCMAGSLGTPLAQDLASFYLFFALMTFSAYGLVIHSRGAEALRAARVYFAFAVAGEGMLIAGLLLAAGAAGSVELGAVRAAVGESPDAALISALLLAGFGVKAGAVPLHPWLALAHPVAPTPASAVLSAAMIKAGLLGWLRLLPLGVVALPALGTLCVVLGLIAAFGAALAGATQSRMKTLLAYSSISQMGLMLVGVGAALAVPAAMPAALGMLAFYALAHGLAKGALFLATGIVEAPPRRRAGRWAVAAGVALPALALAGGPLTAGAIAKGELQRTVGLLGAGGALGDLIQASAIATTVVMGRFLLLARTAARRGGEGAPRPGAGAGLLLPWAALVAALAATPWAASALLPVVIADPYALSVAGLLGAAWPLVAGAALLAAGTWLARRRPGLGRLQVPPGDVLAGYERAASAALAAAGGAAAALGRRREGLAATSAAIGRRDLGLALDELDARLGEWATAAVLLVILSAIVFLLA